MIIRTVSETPPPKIWQLINAEFTGSKFNLTQINPGSERVKHTHTPTHMHARTHTHFHWESSRPNSLHYIFEHSSHILHKSDISNKKKKKKKCFKDSGSVPHCFGSCFFATREKVSTSNNKVFVYIMYYYV